MAASTPLFYFSPKITSCARSIFFFFFYCWKAAPMALMNFTLLFSPSVQTQRDNLNSSRVPKVS